MAIGREPSQLYRFGFLALTAPGGVRTRPNERWHEREVGGLRLLLHEETEVRHVATPAGSATVLGPVFAIGDGDVDGVLARLIDAADVDLTENLSRLSGRFCLILRNSAGTKAYRDPTGTRSIFYSLRDGTYIASHAGLLASQIGAPRSGQAEEFIRTDKYNALSVKYLPGDMTMYDDVVALTPNNRFVFGSGRPERYWPVRERRDHGLDELRARCEAYFKGLARSLAGRPAFIGVTGGIDTRLLFAGLARRGLDLRGMTWLGNYHDPRERPIIDTIVGRMDLEHAYVDVPGPPDEIAKVSGRNSGGYRGISRLTSAITHQMGDLGPAVFLRGYGGEVMRGFYNLLDKPLRDASPEELGRAYALKSKVRDADPAFDRVVLTASQAFAERVGYDALAELGYDINDLFFWEQRVGGWSAAMHNEMDAAMLSMTGLNDRVMFDLAFGLPRSTRLSKALFQDLIAAMEPRLAGLPTA